VGCALLCDDVLIERSGDDLHLLPRCDLGAEWFRRARCGLPQDAPAATIRASQPMSRPL